MGTAWYVFHFKSHIWSPNNMSDCKMLSQEIKLLQIANSALDIVLCMPNVLTHETCRLGPLDAVVAIEQLLSKVGGTKSQRLGLLHQRLTHIPSTTEIPSTIEFHVQEEEDIDSIIY
jgi:hypothetical protein